MQLLNAITEFRESIIESSSTNPFLLGFKGIFKGLNSTAGVQRGHLEKLWTDIFFPMNEIRGVSDYFATTKQCDAFEFIQLCLHILKQDKEHRGQAIRCFQFSLRSTIQAKDDPTNRKDSYYREPQEILDLPISKTPLGKEIDGEFMQALQAFEGKEELTGDRRLTGTKGEKVDTIYYKQIVTPPQVFLMRIMRLNYNEEGKLIKIDRPMAIPQEFTLSSEMMVDSKPVKYKLTGGVTHSGTVNSGHYMAYISGSNDFLEFNDSRVRQIGKKDALKALKVGAYVVAYRRED
jgi:ubiquitin carboxyl-terminal hydrolase 22/27/51